jgi:hypothetical protein
MVRDENNLPSVSGGKGPPDKPGLTETIATYRKEFGELWLQAFLTTVRVNLNYQYSEKE